MGKFWLSKRFFVALLVLTLITAGFAFAQESNNDEDKVLKLSQRMQ